MYINWCPVPPTFKTGSTPLTTRYVDCITNVVNITSLTNVIAISCICICISLCNGIMIISCVSGVFVNGVDISWVFPYSSLCR